MAEYIEREAVMKAFAAKVKRSNNSDFASTPTWNQAVQIVEDYPAADVVPVVHGEWIKDCERTMRDGWTYIQRHCSVCGGQTVECVNYCQFCGAKMDGGADHD